MLAKIRFDLIDDADRVMNSYSPAQAVRQQQLIVFGRYGSRCEPGEDNFLRERTAVEHPYPVQHGGFIAQPRPALAVDPVQFDDGDAKATRSSNKGMPRFMHRRPVSLGIRQRHMLSVAERYVV